MIIIKNILIFLILFLFGCEDNSQKYEISETLIDLPPFDIQINDPWGTPIPQATISIDWIYDYGQPPGPTEFMSQDDGTISLWSYCLNKRMLMGKDEYYPIDTVIYLKGEYTLSAPPSNFIKSDLKVIGDVFFWEDSSFFALGSNQTYFYYKDRPGQEPITFSSIIFPIDNPRSYFKSGDEIWTFEKYNGLWILNVSDPLNPTYTHFNNIPGYYYIVGIHN